MNRLFGDDLINKEKFVFIQMHIGELLFLYIFKIVEPDSALIYLKSLKI